MKILVVDDEKLLVKGMKFNLENEGYQVHNIPHRQHRYCAQRKRTNYFLHTLLHILRFNVLQI